MGISLTPLEVVPPEALLQTLDKLVKEGPVGTLVLGHPTHLDGTPTHSTQAVLALHAKLQAHFPALNIVLWDERLTSKQAQRHLAHSGVRKKQRQQKGQLDLTSAVLLLQDYLNRQT